MHRLLHSFLWTGLAAALAPALPTRLTAQTATTLYSFTGGSDGANPYAGVVVSGNMLYGVASAGGSSGNGTVFAVRADGTGFTNLHSFTGADGSLPCGTLVLSSNTLYGTAQLGSIFGNGTVFSIKTNGTGFTNLHGFMFYGGSDGTNVDGGEPYAGLILSGDTLYGTAQHGGAFGYGTVFALKRDGSGFTNLHSFSGSDGRLPYAPLTLSGTTLYGAASRGGSADSGTVFQLNTDGKGFTKLYDFSATPPPLYSNSDGANPWGGLILSGSTLYGTAWGGGASGIGTVFSVATNGTGFRTLHSFTGTDGSRPSSGLTRWGQTLYGTACGCGSGAGTAFAVNLDGTAFTNLVGLVAPEAALTLSSNVLYGTDNYGGTAGGGSIFRLSFPPRLDVARSGAYVVLTWPANDAGFVLQSTTNLAAAAVWLTNLPAPVVVNGEYAVTNPISGARQFFRLSR